MALISPTLSSLTGWTWPPPPYGMADGATQVQPSGWSGGSCFQVPSALVPRWGGSSLPLRPVWPSWMAGTAPWLFRVPGFRRFRGYATRRNIWLKHPHLDELLHRLGRTGIARCAALLGDGDLHGQPLTGLLAYRRRTRDQPHEAQQHKSQHP